MLTCEIILGKLEENISTIKKLGIRKIGLFGSFAKNEQTADSDIDFLIEFITGQKTFDNYMELKIFLEDLFQKKVDLLILENIKPEIKPNILESVKYAKGATTGGVKI